MIEFIEEAHIYLLNGVITPCVSDILRFIFPNKYKGVDKRVLTKKAEYGSVVHKAIECLEQNLDMPELNYIQEASLDQYKKIKEDNNIKVISQEQKIHYENF